MGAVARVKESLATGGLVSVGRGVMRWALSPLLRYEKHVVLEMLLDAEAALTGGDHQGVRAWLGAESDLAAFVHRGLMTRADFLRLCRKLELGQELVIAGVDGDGMGYAFVDYKRLTVGGIETVLPVTTSYNDSNFVFQKYRGRGLQQAMLRFIVKTSHRRGRTRCLALVLSHNRASLRAHARVGFRRIGIIRVIRLFGRWQALTMHRDLLVDSERIRT